jgi:Xaa-Pro aminopeptidase
MGGWGHLEAPPAEADWEFAPAEYRRRAEAARRGMAAAGVDCLFLTSEKNIRYLTGFHTQFWVSPTRPYYVLLPAADEPVAIAPGNFVPGFRTTSWIADIRSWPAPRPADDGVSLAIEALGASARAGGRIGVELGPESRLGMPVGDFLRIREALDGRAFVDAGPLLRSLRMVKSAEEVARLRRAAEIACDGFDRLAERLGPGLSERDVYHLFHRILVELRADKVPYLVPVSGPHGYDQASMGPTDRRLGEGDLLTIDVGATWRGYFSDFNRNFAIRRATDEFRRAYARAFEATEAGIAAVRPGRTAADVWRAMAAVADPGGRAENPAGRMGHGLGLDLTEPPSLAAGDATVLEEGMVLTIEPILILPAAGGMPWRRMIHEEEVVVTRGGCELLTRRAAPALPVV